MSHTLNNDACRDHVSTSVGSPQPDVIVNSTASFVPCFRILQNLHPGIYDLNDHPRFVDHTSVQGYVCDMMLTSALRLSHAKSSRSGVPFAAYVYLVRCQKIHS